MKQTQIFLLSNSKWEIIKWFTRWTLFCIEKTWLANEAKYNVHYCNKITECNNLTNEYRPGNLMLLSQMKNMLFLNKKVTGS